MDEAMSNGSTSLAPTIKSRIIYLGIVPVIKQSTKYEIIRSSLKGRRDLKVSLTQSFVSKSWSEANITVGTALSVIGFVQRNSL